MIRPVHVTSTRLGELIASCPAEYADVAITGATADNRQVEPKDLFFVSRVPQHTGTLRE